MDHRAIERESDVNLFPAALALPRVATSKPKNESRGRSELADDFVIRRHLRLHSPVQTLGLIGDHPARTAPGERGRRESRR
jgi:hypothetical protein